MGGSGPVLLGLVLAKGEFCCLFILVLSSTCDAKRCQAGQLSLPCSQNLGPHLPYTSPQACPASPFPFLSAHQCGMTTSYSSQASGKWD